MAIEGDWHPNLAHLVERVRRQTGLVAYNRERAHRTRTVEAEWTLRSAEDELADRLSALRSHIRGATPEVGIET